MNEISKPRNVLQHRRGQGMTEYLLIVALIAVASIAVVTVFGNNIRNLFAMSATSLAGGANANNNGNQNAGQFVNKNVSTFSNTNQVP